MLFRLVDTEGCWTVAESAIFAEHGHPFGPEQKALVIGRTVEAAGEAMAQYLGRPGAGPGLAAELLARVREELSRGAMALTGAAELLRACRAAVPVAVASNSPRELLDTALWSAGLAGHLTHTFAADEVHSPKPSPELYLTACEALGAPPDTPSPSRTRPRVSPRHTPPGCTSPRCRPCPAPTSTTTGWGPAWPNPSCWPGPKGFETAGSDLGPTPDAGQGCAAQASSPSFSSPSVER